MTQPIGPTILDRVNAINKHLRLSVEENRAARIELNDLVAHLGFTVPGHPFSETRELPADNGSGGYPQLPVARFTPTGEDSQADA